MDEQRYLDLAKKCLDEILDAFETIDIEEADVEPAGDVIKIRFNDGAVCVVNTQRPVRQMWLAADARAWHFDWHDETKKWMDHKTGSEIYATIQTIAHAHGVDISFS